MCDRVQPDALPLVIRLATPDNLPALEHHLHRGFPQRHRPFVELQVARKASYLIAWSGHIPIGHVVIEWAWVPQHEDAMATLFAGRTVLYDFYVTDAYRSRGVGSQMLLTVDQAAQEQHVS